MLQKLLGMLIEANKFSALLARTNRAFQPREVAPAGTEEFRVADAEYKASVDALVDFIHTFRTRAVLAEEIVATQKVLIEKLEAQIEKLRSAPVGAQASRENNDNQADAQDKKAELRSLFGDDMPDFLKELLDDPNTHVLKF